MDRSYSNKHVGMLISNAVQSIMDRFDYMALSNLPSLLSQFLVISMSSYHKPSNFLTFPIKLYTYLKSTSERTIGKEFWKTNVDRQADGHIDLIITY